MLAALIIHTSSCLVMGQSVPFVVGSLSSGPDKHPAGSKQCNDTLLLTWLISLRLHAQACLSSPNERGRTLCVQRVSVFTDTSCVQLTHQCYCFAETMLLWADSENRVKLCSLQLTCCLNITLWPCCLAAGHTIMECTSQKGGSDLCSYTNNEMLFTSPDKYRREKLE